MTPPRAGTQDLMSAMGRKADIGGRPEWVESGHKLP
jgi:hypothetical protein